MFNQQNQMPYSCQGCQQAYPTYQQYNQVLQTCNVENIPHMVNYHTHVVNNCIKRHITIPTYTSSQEVVVQEEFDNGGYPANMYGQMPYPANQMGCGAMAGYNQQMMQKPMQYQGNVGVEPMMQQGMEYPGMNMSFKY